MVTNRRLDDTSAEQVRGFGIRHLQCLFIFAGLTVAYALRVNISVAIVAMTDVNGTNSDFEEYDWGEKTKSFVLSSFFWGYVVTQLPAGQMAHYFGAKLFMLFGVTICSALTVLTPLCASLGGWKLVCASRFVQGLCQGVMYPCTHALLSKWAPVQERGKLNTICYSGTQFGTVLMLAASGVIASSSAGWPGIFYVSGAAGLLWSVIWYCFGASSPSQYKSISPEEQRFIEESLDQQKDDTPDRGRTPWLEFFKSVPFLSLIVVHAMHVWGFWTLLTEIPSYMSKVLGMNIKSNALLSALPYAVMWLLSYVFCVIADILSKNQRMSLFGVRRMFNTIGMWIPALALVGMGYMTKDTTNLAVGLLVIAVGVNSAVYLGYLVNHIDLSPNYAGTLMGISNAVANIMSLLGPLIVGMLVSDENDPTQWRVVFFMIAAAYFAGNLLWCIFGKAKVQPWNSPNILDRFKPDSNGVANKDAEKN